MQKRARLNQTNTITKLIGIGRSRERPTYTSLYSSSLCSVQLYLVWSQRVTSNYMEKKCTLLPVRLYEYKKKRNANAKLRTCTSTRFFIFFSFSLFYSLSHASFSASLSRTLFLLSFSLVSRIAFTHSHTLSLRPIRLDPLVRADAKQSFIMR